jgi:hypothetical protein
MLCTRAYLDRTARRKADWVRCVQVQRDINKRLKSTRRDIAVKLIQQPFEKQAGDAGDEDMEVCLVSHESQQLQESGS